MCEGSYNFICFQVLLGSLRYRVRSSSVLGKTWLLVRFLLAEFGIFPMSNCDI